MSGLFTIGAEGRFADELARGVLAQHGADPLALADVLILVPTRRAVRALREAFLRVSEGRPLVLPRIGPLGDVEDDSWEAASGGIEALELPPAIDLAEREALLSELVAAFKDDEGEPVAKSAAQALKLARELAALFDELSIEGVAFEQLDGLVEASFAGDWQRTVRFLSIVGKAWPAILAERQQIDVIERRSAALRARTLRWLEEPPQTPVIAAGSTGSQRPTRDLLKVVAQLPQGAVVLPGLDRSMDEASWLALDATHPQFGLRELLSEFQCPRGEVADWPGSGATPGPIVTARRELISELMRPAETSESWSRPSASSLDHLTRADCATPQQEALTIALALRQVLEEPGRTAALVTPDRGLARRVAAELRRWDVEIDDSAGIPLAQTPPARLLLALVAAVDAGFAPVALLSLLQHPLCTLGRDRADLLAAVRRLDRRCLRGLKPAPGLAALQARIAGKIKPEQRLSLEGLVDDLDRATRALAEAMAESEGPGTLLDLTIAAAEAIAPQDTLWSGEAGQALADSLTRLRPAWAAARPVPGGEWPALLAAMLEPEIVRPAHGRHPRLAIWGPLEARLQQADLLVLGGLNEGTWPPSVESGPWINRPMRAALGLPQPERRIGLSAHDFAMAIGAERVLLTRSEREGGAPTVTSRWLTRLDALFAHDPGSALPPPPYIQRARRSLLAWADVLDRPAGYAPWPRPRPVPPLEARPRSLSVSSVEQWRRDPYGLYARQILNLSRLDPLEEELGARDRGDALHKAFHTFLRRHPSGLLPGDAVRELESLGEHELALLLAVPAERAFWWPRFQRLARWIVATENDRRQSGSRLLDSETKGELHIAAGAGRLRIKGVADRIDRLDGETWEIIDYKTGRLPSKDELDALYAPQLLLEAAMAGTGGFTAIAGTPSRVELAYWQTNGLGDGGKISPIADSESLVGKLLAYLKKAVAHYGRPDTAYPAVPWPRYAPPFNDYEHLERIAEWSTAGVGEE
ncbi:MAG: double-strand break repair protein AddB [Reyranellaceae bacterium]